MFLYVFAIACQLVEPKSVICLTFVSILFYSAVGIRPNLCMSDIYFTHCCLTSEHQAQQYGDDVTQVISRLCLCVSVCVSFKVLV